MSWGTRRLPSPPLRTPRPDSVEDARFKKLRVGNEHFQEECGRFMGGVECFLAVGYVENPTPDELFLVLEEPDPFEDFDAWEASPCSYMETKCAILA